MPIGPFPDFDACVAHMMKPKEEGGGGYDDETARKVCGKMKAELEESFSWAGDIRSYPGAKLIRGEAIHPIKTFHPFEWPRLRVYFEDELEKSAETLVGKPLFLDHWRPLNGKVLGACYEDGALEYVAELNDPDILQMIRDGQIKHASVQFEWKSLENVNGVVPHGINHQHLSLLKDMEPGDPMSTVEIWESIIRQLKEAKALTPPNLTQRLETEDKIKMESLKERIWRRAHKNDLPDSAFALILSGGERDEQGKTVPRTLRKFPHHTMSVNVDPVHLRNANSRVGAMLKESSPHPDISIEQLNRAKAHLDRHKRALGIGAAAEESKIPFKHAWTRISEQGEPEEIPEVEFEVEPEPTMDELIQFLEDAFDEIDDAIEAINKKFAELEKQEIQEQQGEDYKAFISQCMEAGKTMEQCAAEWKEQHPEGTSELEEANKTIEALKGQIKALEDQNTILKEEMERAKKANEAIIPSTVTPPSDILKEIKRLLPERVPMSWGGHYAQLWRNLRNIIKKHEGS